MLVFDALNKIIFVPQSYLTFVGGTFYTMDTDAFWRDLKDVEDSEVGICFDDIQFRASAQTVAGSTYAPTVGITNGFRVEFEDGQYTVQLEGTNNNIWSVQDNILVQNQVQVIPTNSFGLVLGGSALTAEQIVWLRELWQLFGLDAANQVTVTPTSVNVADISQTLGGDGETLTTIDRS